MVIRAVARTLIGGGGVYSYIQYVMKGDWSSFHPPSFQSNWINKNRPRSSPNVTKIREDSSKVLMPLALTTLFGKYVKLLCNFCILQNILDRDLDMRILFVVFQCACNSYMESYFCSGRGIYILQKMKFY